jgi:colanic acid/amylovoran biosynthesis glycosyltransferase
VSGAADATGAVAGDDGRPCVAHYVKRWLPGTNTWIHAQVAHQRRWRAVVLSERLKQPERFPVAAHHSLAHLPPHRWVLDAAALRARGFAPSHRQALRAAGASVIHAHFGMGGYRALPLARAAGLPLVTTFYGADLSLFPRRDARWLKRYARLFDGGTLFLLEGPHMRDSLIALGCPPEKALVQALGVDLERFPFRHRAPDSDGTVRVLVCGRFTEKKGIPDAVAAFALARAVHPRARLTIIGDAAGREDAAEKQAILDAIRRFGVGDAVELRGARPYPELIEAYGTHHILLAPSVTSAAGETEGGAPVVITEAQATGMPVIATRHCDIPAVVRDGESGFLAAERDPTTVGALLAELIGRPDRWAAIGSAGRRHVEQGHDVRRQADLLAERYEDAARRHNARYWSDRAGRLGRRSVFHARHSEAELEAVTAMQRRAILPVLDRHLRGDESIALDYGCGWGRFTGDLTERVGGLAIGIDPVPQLVAMAPRPPRTAFLAGSPATVPLATESVDLLWIALVLGTVTDPALLARTVEELRRVLRPGGLMLLVENTADRPDVPHYTYRSVAAYRALFPDVELAEEGMYEDLGERITILAGRRRM